jgi:hypothetical protein
LAFRRFVNGSQWQKAPREPSAIHTSMQALYERAQRARDEIAEKKRERKRLKKLAARVTSKKPAPPGSGTMRAAERERATVPPP